MINKVILVGNVGMDPEVRTLETGVKTARVRLATTEKMYNRETRESTDHTEWHTITLWRGLADVVDRYVRKGSQIYIEGRLRTREWTDKDNNKRYSTEILADEMKLLGRRPEGGEQQSAGGYGAQQQGYAAPQQSYAAPQQPAYTAQPAPAAAPAAPAMDDVDDLPF
jgi:single-strand DNA-binding protein